jgi:hypothetical protein
MICTITIVRYPNWFGWGGFLSMAIFRLPLVLNKKISFWKLMGTGKNGSFDKTPDLKQWAILTVENTESSEAINDLDSNSSSIDINNGEASNIASYLSLRYGKWMVKWWQLFHCEIWTILLDPMEGHGLWDGKQPFTKVATNSPYQGPIAILTRATIKLSKLKNFWTNVGAVANKMSAAKGFMGSFGIGEVPWIKQATFSIWESKEDMKLFAYKMQEHTSVINKTRKEKWYSEDLFMRFIPLGSLGSIKGIDPLKRKP